MWNAQTENIKGGRRYQILQGGDSLSFRSVFSLLEEDADFAGWYTDLLAGSEFEAFFWEHPPLTTATYDNLAEFVLIESPSLVRLRPDPEPFRPQFERHQEKDVATFPNLGGDAVLVAPRPVGPLEAYVHLGAFLRQAPERQVRSLWQQVARAVRENLSVTPRWLSTVGMGVSWLHIRLDSRPKYYRFGPYKTV